MSFEKDSELQAKIFALIEEHFKETGKVLSAATFKYDMKALKENRIDIIGYSRRWKYPGDKR